MYEQILPEDSYDTIKHMRVFQKLQWSCTQALKDGLDYLWIDTCCINKDSSAELQEAINSMFRWYESAVVCYAYLSDFDSSDVQGNPFGDSAWFQRGWTLQELLAPKSLIFYDRFWRPYGNRVSLADEVSRITTINPKYLTGIFSTQERPLHAEIMSWACGRKTTRIEDRAYSLIGLFGLSMPMLYGEGERAFLRLQEELLRTSDDQSIFAWEGVTRAGTGLLADSPDNFPPTIYSSRNLDFRVQRRSPHAITPEGISLEVEAVPWSQDVFLALMNFQYIEFSRSRTGSTHVHTGIFLKRIDSEQRFSRIKTTSGDLLRLSTGDNGHIECLQGYKKLRCTIVREVRLGTEMDRLRCLNIDGFELHGPAWEKWLSKDVAEVYTRGDFNKTTNILSMQEGRRGVVGMLTFPGNGLYDGAVKRIALGFDWYFRPVCIVVDRDYDPHPSFKQRSAFDEAEALNLAFKNLLDRPEETWGKVDAKPSGKIKVLDSQSFDVAYEGTGCMAFKVKIIDSRIVIGGLRAHKLSRDPRLTIQFGRGDLSAPWKVWFEEENR